MKCNALRMTTKDVLSIKPHSTRLIAHLASSEKLVGERTMKSVLSMSYADCIWRNSNIKLKMVFAYTLGTWVHS